MSAPEPRPPREPGVSVADPDTATLERLGYKQELSRTMGRFSNFAISFSIICILAGGITSFQLAFSSVGGAAIGLGWPLVCLMSLAVAVAMGQVASAFPTAGGLYHWATILGGRGWGWVTAWFNLAGLVAVLAAINMGTMHVIVGSLGPRFGYDAAAVGEDVAQVVLTAGVVVITLSQALFNHLGIRLTSKLTDFSGYLILVVAAVLTVSLFAYAPSFEPSRLVRFQNFSGPAGGDVWPATSSGAWLFALGFLHAGYTITGFDASAHTSEETHDAARNVPRGMVSAVLVSGIAGWVMVCALVLAMPSVELAAAQGGNVVFHTIEAVLPRHLATALLVGVALANYLCGLATVTSCSRMLFAFARDGGLPWSSALARVSARHRVPAVAIWTSAGLAIALTAYTPVYVTITIVCVIFLYISYVLPTLLGIFTYGRSWTRRGPFDVGRWYRPLAVLCVLWCGVLIAIGIEPPYDLAIRIVAGTLVLMAVVWFTFEKKRFVGPPLALSASGGDRR
jgi:amino acid transporter